MKPIRFVVISRGRAESIRQKTVGSLLAAKVPASQITVFAHPDELADYRQALPGFDVKAGGPNLTQQRQQVFRAWGAGQRVVSCDDDIAGWVLPNKTRVPDMVQLADFMFKAADRASANLWGFYPVNNPYFFKKRVVYGCRFIIGQTFGFVADDHWASVAIPCKVKDDWWLSLRAFEVYGSVARLDGVAAVAPMRAPGGIADMTADRAKLNSIDVDYLLEAFPGLVVERPARVAGDRELRIPQRVNKPFAGLVLPVTLGG